MCGCVMMMMMMIRTGRKLYLWPHVLRRVQTYIWGDSIKQSILKKLQILAVNMNGP